ncbi:MAG: energy transducer TonB [Planctomycetota bacterium]|jgi:protein TonB
MNPRSLLGSAFLHISLILGAGIGLGMNLASPAEDLPELSFRPTSPSRTVTREIPPPEEVEVEVEEWQDSPQLSEPVLDEDFAPQEEEPPLPRPKPGWDPRLMQKIPVARQSEPIIEPDLVEEAEPSLEAPAPEAAYVPPKPRVDLNKPPEYPRAARRQGLEGDVLLELAIDAQGRVQSVDLISACRHPALNAAAIRAAKEWQYEPALRQGQASSDRIRERIEFRIEG